MYISKLSIENFRNFKDFEIKLKPFTLIIGENNVGKTNLINALNLIFSNEVLIFKKRVLEIEDINFDCVEHFKKSVVNLSHEASTITFPEVKIEVEMRDFNDDQKAVVSDWFIDDSFDKARLVYSFHFRNLQREEWVKRQREIIETAYSKYLEKSQLDNDALNDGTIEEKTDFFARHWNLVDFPIKDYYYSICGGYQTTQAEGYYLKMLKMEFLDAMRDAKKELIASNDYRLLYRVLANRDEDKYSDLKNELLKLNEAVKGNEELKKIAGEIGSYLKKISIHDSDGDNSVNFQFSTPETFELLKKLSLVYGQSPVNVSRNGLGRNNLLYIALLISHLSAKAFGEDEVYFRLIAIEEPEAHLHTHLQNHLSRNLKGEINCDHKEKQLILTSHSTNISSKLDLSNTVALFKDTSQNHKYHYLLDGFPGNADGKRRIRFLQKYLDATNSTMFFSRKLILVEGASEEILVPEMFKLKTDRTIEEYGIGLINVRGVAFRNFLDIVKNGYFIKCLVLTDSDRGTKTEDRAEKLIEDYKDIDVIRVETTKESTFEKDIISENKRGKGKDIILTALNNTRPVVYGERWNEFYEVDTEIEVHSFFEEIEPRIKEGAHKGEKAGDYKAEFASNLAVEISDGFNIPKYIINGIEFLIG